MALLMRWLSFVVFSPLCSFTHFFSRSWFKAFFLLSLVEDAVLVLKCFLCSRFRFPLWFLCVLSLLLSEAYNTQKNLIVRNWFIKLWNIVFVEYHIWHIRLLCLIWYSDDIEKKQVSFPQRPKLSKNVQMRIFMTKKLWNYDACNECKTKRSL